MLGRPNLSNAYFHLKILERLSFVRWEHTFADIFMVSPKAEVLVSHDGTSDKLGPKKDLPAVQAVLGKQGIFDGYDYRGVHTLAYLAPIPKKPYTLKSLLAVVQPLLK
jgi:hypothetical protein